MAKELNFALYAIKKNIQSSAELRTSFLSNIVGMAINNSAFVFIWIFFVKSVGVINGWQAVDIIALLGFGSLSYGVVFSAAYGIRNLTYYVAIGSFDRFMLSPKNLLLRVATATFSVSALGDIFFGIASLTIYAILIKATIIQIIFIIPLVLMSVVIFFSVAVIIYSTSFLFMDAFSVAKGLFDLFMSPTLFHGGAFQGAMRIIFTFFIPSLAIGALPVEIIKDTSLQRLAIIGIIAAIWFILSIKLFYAGVKKYESSNFMTFGN